MLRRVEENELSQIISARKEGEPLDLSNCLFENMDLSGWDLHGICFDKSDFREVALTVRTCPGVRLLMRSSKGPVSGM